MDVLNAFVALLNFVIIPATAYGAQLALGGRLALTLIYGDLAVFQLRPWRHDAPSAGHW